MAVYRECFVIVKRQYPIDFKLERRTTSHYALFFRARDLLQSDSPNSLCNNLSSTIRMLESHNLTITWPQASMLHPYDQSNG